MITIATTTATFTPSKDIQRELARLTLALAVPIEIEHLCQFGGPNDYQMDAAHGYIQRQRLGEAILFTICGKTREQMRVLIEITAILAYCPGGVRVCGLHFEAERVVVR